jgi:bifunctional UDP-N-acetylglucosamine pyrophosphorylase/glucosamine-1-phosphate N-acetyltransferase
MTTRNLQAIILAAGKSSRFKTGKTKLLEKICGQEMILYPTRLFSQMNIPTTVVVGFQKEAIVQTLQVFHTQSLHEKPVSFVEQEEQHGTGHAIWCTRTHWHQENILIMNGDMPLVSEDIIEALYTKHITTNAAISFVVAHNADPNVGGYGRVVTEDNHIEIVEAKNFKGDHNKHCCINAGIYIVKRSFLEQHIDAIQKNEIGKEFYFTDIVGIASKQGLPVATLETHFDRIRGINTFQELWAAEQIKRGELIKYWMDHGVRFSVAQNVHIDLDVVIGSGSAIGCGVHLLGKTIIGNNSDVHEFSTVENCVIGNNTAIQPHCFVKNSIIGSHVNIGPFAHVHTNSHIDDHARIGNFVEVKNCTIGAHTKAKHLAFLGDAHIGSRVNIGAGTIICNYNGSTKNTTTIQDNVFIGSNNTLVAPLTVAAHAFTAAGSVITDDVPAGALAIARARQVNKEGYVQKLKEKQQWINAAAQEKQTPPEHAE